MKLLVWVSGRRPGLFCLKCQSHCLLWMFSAGWKFSQTVFKQRRRTKEGESRTSHAELWLAPASLNKWYVDNVIHCCGYFSLSVSHVIRFPVGRKASETAFRQCDTKLSRIETTKMKFFEAECQICAEENILWHNSVSIQTHSQPRLCINNVHSAEALSSPSQSHGATHLHPQDVRYSCKTQQSIYLPCSCRLRQMKHLSGQRLMQPPHSSAHCYPDMKTCQIKSVLSVAQFFNLHCSLYSLNLIRHCRVLSYFKGHMLPSLI